MEKVSIFMGFPQTLQHTTNKGSLFWNRGYCQKPELVLLLSSVNAKVWETEQLSLQKRALKADASSSMQLSRSQQGWIEEWGDIKRGLLEGGGQ